MVKKLIGFGDYISPIPEYVFKDGRMYPIMPDLTQKEGQFLHFLKIKIWIFRIVYLFGCWMILGKAAWECLAISELMCLERQFFNFKILISDMKHPEFFATRCSLIFPKIKGITLFASKRMWTFFVKNWLRSFGNKP